MRTNRKYSEKAVNLWWKDERTENREPTVSCTFPPSHACVSESLIYMYWCFFLVVCSHGDNSGFILRSLIRLLLWIKSTQCWPLILILACSANCCVTGTSWPSHHRLATPRLPQPHNYNSTVTTPPASSTSTQSTGALTGSQKPTAAKSSGATPSTTQHAAGGNTGPNGQTTAATTLKAGSASLSSACSQRLLLVMLVLIYSAQSWTCNNKANRNTGVLTPCLFVYHISLFALSSFPLWLIHKLSLNDVKFCAYSLRENLK